MNNAQQQPDDHRRGHPGTKQRHSLTIGPDGPILLRCSDDPRSA